MQKYIITQDYFDQYPQLADFGFEVGDIVFINGKGRIEKVPEGGAQTNDIGGEGSGGDPINPPPQHPPILP